MPNAYFTLRSMAGGSQGDPGKMIDNIRDALDGCPEEGVFRIRLVDETTEESAAVWNLRLGGGGCRTEQADEEPAKFELVLSPETWRSVASGDLAPLRAFVGGRMRVRGDADWGTRVLHQLAEPTKAAAEGERAPWQ